MKKNLLGLLIIAVMAVSSIVIAGQDMGAENMSLSGGSFGNVSFPHNRHQLVPVDCNKCHNLFPKTAGALEQLKENKTLKKKKLMNQCKGCHKAMKKSGLKTGPTSCTKCHKK